MLAGSDRAVPAIRAVAARMVPRHEGSALVEYRVIAWCLLVLFPGSTMARPGF